VTTNNYDLQTDLHSQETYSLSDLFYVWWCMPCIILRLQQQTCLLKSELF